MSIEAMKQALEALERSVTTCFDQYAHQQAMSQPDHFINQTITSLRQAIAEAEKQKPVAWFGLTDDEVFDIYKQFDLLQYRSFAKALEAKLKEKNHEL